MSENPKSIKDIDDFWDLDSLLPKRRSVAPSYPHANTDAVEITVDTKNSSDAGTPIPPRDNSINKLPLRQRVEEYRSKPLDPYLIYNPNSRLIKHVEISRWSTRFNFYEKFITDAKKLWARKGEVAEHTPFFSYLPQYSQLNFSQMKWYLWWRENVRNSVYLRCDFCYILLYIFEILNCPSELDPRIGVINLSEIWLNYRNAHPRLDRYMCEWLCDYCLIHELPCPTAKLKPILHEITEIATLKEFYMDFSDAEGLCCSIISGASSYNFKKSRYITKENAPLFKEHIYGAVSAASKKLLSQPHCFELFGTDFRVNRVSYESALCTYTTKRSIAVEYTSYTRSPKFGFMATDLVKYSENRIRAYLGIRPRLKVEGIDEALKQELDCYFDSHLPLPKKAPKRRSMAEIAEAEAAVYERNYEPITADFSLENALEIEKKSWETTELLTSAFEEEIPEEVPSPTAEVPTKMVPGDENEFMCLIDTLGEAEMKLLSEISAGDFLGSCLSADAVIDKINEIAYDLIGDIIIEKSETGYRLIPDYEGDIKEWLK